MVTKNNRHRAVGTIVLPTITAAALWTCEIAGQLSDGMWENASPHNHWQFWNALTAMHVPNVQPSVKSDGYCMKKNYNLLKLLDLGKNSDDRFCLRDRMIAMAKMAIATKDLDHDDYTRNFLVGNADAMPADLSAWKNAKSTRSWSCEYVADYMAKITDEIAEAFYAAKYDQKDLKVDLASIKAAMITA